MALLVNSCSEAPVKSTEEVKAIHPVDINKPAVITLDTAFAINGKTYAFKTKQFNAEYGLLLVSNGAKQLVGDTIQMNAIYSYTFPDINHDGYADVLISYYSNYPREELYLFDAKTNSFFNYGQWEYPYSKLKRSNPKLFTSTYKTGCAGDSWESHLFKFNGLATIELGYMYIDLCDTTNSFIKIYKSEPDNRKGTLLDSMQAPQQVRKLSWEWSEMYWNKSWPKFIKP